MVWEWLVSSDELPHAKKKYLTSGTLRRPDGVQLRVISVDAPSRDARQVSPTFEDAYLKLVSDGQKVI